ncbi:Imm72 family immunity protein [Burkholderia gladioli]|uniref:Imm72 family immunity protein n=1 Tax=Burkholderia gladioli TaxID=28095 RepID=UPI003B983D56
MRGSGCFNYLIRDIRAPGLRSHESRTVQTHWRLLWEDKRYSDGIIPDESQYFLGQSSVSQPDVAAVTPAQTGDR